MKPKNDRAPNPEHAGSQGEEARGLRLWITAVSAAFLVAGLILVLLGIELTLGEVFFALALVIATVPVLWDAFKRIRTNLFNADLLMGIAAIGAALIGVWEEGAAVLILYNIAETIEDYTADRVRKVAEKMANLLPKRALVRKNGQLEEVPADQLQIGQIVIVKPGWRIPVDGTIVSGHSSIDQSAVTGESIPLEKKINDEVLSGTLNLEGSLEVHVKKAYRDSTINRIVKLVTEARERKANIERFIDRFSKYYTPTMLIVAISIALIPPLFLGDLFSIWVYRGLIALIVACPSAFVIATPVTILMGLTRAMWSGVLIKGGRYLEEVSKTRAVAFDKTGTLTLGKLKVSEIITFSDFQKSEVLRLAALAESKSSHPIGLAVVNSAKDQGLSLEGKIEIKEIVGKGIEASLENNDKILVGKPSFLEEYGLKIDISLINGIVESGNTIVAVSINERPAGLITVADQVREEADETIKRLKAMGVEQVYMLTGDNEVTAKNIANKLKITKYHAGLLPEQKMALVNTIREKYGSIIMVGDGINDAPVLAASNVGIALGTAGNDIAIEASDIALMGSDLRAVPYIIKLGKKVMSKLKFNIVLTLGFKFLMIVLGALGLIPLWFAILGDDGLTIIVIINALPLLRFKNY